MSCSLSPHSRTSLIHDFTFLLSSGLTPRSTPHVLRSRPRKEECCRRIVESVFLMRNDHVTKTLSRGLSTSTIVGHHDSVHNLSYPSVAMIQRDDLAHWSPVEGRRHGQYTVMCLSCSAALLSVYIPTRMSVHRQRECTSHALLTADKKMKNPLTPRR